MSGTPVGPSTPPTPPAPMRSHNVIVLVSSVTAPVSSRTQRPRTWPGPSGATGDSGAGVQRDARLREDVAGERRSGAERRGTPDPPKHIATLCTVDQRNNL